MLDRFLQGFKRRGAARNYARRLPPQLRKDYGASATYTPVQIAASAFRAKLPQEYIMFGYAAFLTKEAFEALKDFQSLFGYEELRLILGRYALHRAADSGFEPAPENPTAVGGA